MLKTVYVLCVSGVFCISTQAQQPAAPMLLASAAAVPALSSSTLPDAPSAVAESSSAATESLAINPPQASAGRTVSTPKPAGEFQKYIEPGQAVPKLTAYDKAILGIRDAVSPLSAAGWLISAGYEQIVNGSPNFPQTGKGFAQRLGAGAARDASEGIFGDSILSPIFHEDPRYYKLGKGHPFLSRAVYSVTRVLVRRTDGGRETINLAELGGDAAGSALTQAYYPPLNRGFTQVAETFGGSLGGDALGYLGSEFLSDALSVFHSHKNPNP